jgi:ribonuclease HI
MMMRRYYLRATNNTIELGAVTEALGRFPDGMRVWISTKLNYAKMEMTEWIHTWKRNGWNNAKKEHATNATLWPEYDSAVARQANGALTLVKALKGTPLSEFTDQLAILSVKESPRGRRSVGNAGDLGTARTAIETTEEVSTLVQTSTSWAHPCSTPKTGEADESSTAMIIQRWEIQTSRKEEIGADSRCGFRSQNQSHLFHPIG